MPKKKKSKSGNANPQSNTKMLKRAVRTIVGASTNVHDPKPSRRDVVYNLNKHLQKGHQLTTFQLEYAQSLWVEEDQSWDIPFMCSLDLVDIFKRLVAPTDGGELFMPVPEDIIEKIIHALHALPNCSIRHSKILRYLVGEMHYALTVEHVDECMGYALMNTMGKRTREFIKFLFDHFSIDKYLDYLSTEKSENLTQFSTPHIVNNNHQTERLSNHDYLYTMWPTRLAPLMVTNPEIIPRCIDMLSSLYRNCAAFRVSTQVKICAIVITIEIQKLNPENQILQLRQLFKIFEFLKLIKPQNSLKTLVRQSFALIDRGVLGYTDRAFPNSYKHSRDQVRESGKISRAMTVARFGLATDVTRHIWSLVGRNV